jgi:hypothetical protein
MIMMTACLAALEFVALLAFLIVHLSVALKKIENNENIELAP